MQSQPIEQRKILEMLADGKIDPADAERLLAKLAECMEGEGTARESQTAARGSREPQLRVISRTEQGDDIDVSIPLQLLATGIDFEKLLPEVAREAIEETGIELSELANLRGDTLIDAIRSLEVDVTGHDGGTLSIHCD